MKSFLKTNTDTSHQRQVENYYRFHAPIYDATRWSFLFGRSSTINRMPDLTANPRILEIGCGTGSNILQLKKRFPDAEIQGIDLSDSMLSTAQEKISASSNISLKKLDYVSESMSDASFDAIVLSYSLTMMGKNYQTILQQIQADLKPDGIIAVVDFYTTPFSLFERWMRMNHVDFSGSSLFHLQQQFEPIKKQIHSAYFGLWNYYQFIGKL